MTTTLDNKSNSGKVIAGMIFIAIGIYFLLEMIGATLPDWLISIPSALIVWGLYTGYRQNFKSPSALIILFIGIIWMIDKQIESVDLLVPTLFIGAGLLIIFRRNNAGWKNITRKKAAPFDWDKRVPSENDPIIIGSTGQQYTKEESKFGANDDFIDSVAIFGGVKKNIVSKDFRGGDIVNFFGGAELNLIQADINGRVVLDVTQVFGGTKIIVPPHWEISSEMSAIFGSIEDKRPIHSDLASSGKVLVIRGTSIFGGIDIRSY